jgi:hypothetical protein
MAKRFRSLTPPSFLIFSLLGLFSCQGQKKAQSNLPAPGRERLPQIYVFWDSANQNLELPWAPPDPELFLAETDTNNGLAARVVVENSSDPNLLETRVRDWNSRPHDLIMVGPNPVFFQKLRTLQIPTSQASGKRLFISDLKTLKAVSGKNPLWETAAIDEKSAVRFLEELCRKKFTVLKGGCSFSESSRKRPVLAKLPAGDVSVQFSEFKSDPQNQMGGAMLSLSISWDHYFRNFMSGPVSALHSGWGVLRFSDGIIQVKVAKGAPEELVKEVKILTLQLLGDGG